MTVSNSTNKIIGSGNGVTTSWPFSFKVFDPGHLVVTYTDAAGDETTLDSGQYVVTLNADQDASPGGTVSYSPAIASGTKLTLLRSVPYTQAIDIKNQGGFFPEVLERGFDLVVMQVQQLKEQLARAFKLSPSQSAIGELEATDANRANTFLGFGPTGLLTLFSGLASTAVSLAMQPVIAAASLAAGRTAFGVPGLGDNNTLTGNNTLSGTTTVSGAATFSAATVVPTPSDPTHAVRKSYVDQGDRQSIWGLTYANNSGDPTNDIDIAAGGCMDATGAVWLLGGALTKRLDANWAAGNNAGGLSSGSSFTNADYYIYAIASSTGAADYIFVQQGVSLVYPGGYTHSRLIGWFKRSGGAIVAFNTSEMAGGGLDYRWATCRLDVDLTNTLTTSRRTDVLSVPQSFSTIALIRTMLTDASAGFNAIICCPDETDGAPSATAIPLLTHSMSAPGSVSTGDMAVKTSSTGTIASRATLVTVDAYRVATYGFQWSRR